MIRIGVPDRRHLIVAYTDGADTISILSPDTVREVAGFADALVHVVVPTSPDRRRPAGAPARASWLSDVTTRTGGQVFEVDSEAPIGARVHARDRGISARAMSCATSRPA